MKRALLTLAILGFIAAVLIVICRPRPSPARSTTSPVQDAVESAITNPLSAITNPLRFARSHFTGGIGAMLRADQTNGVPIVVQVIPGSPAEAAGLQAQDRILSIDGVATSGRTLAQNVDNLRGFAESSVTLTIQRPGSTNLQCILHRSSWKNLGVTQ
jgi:carboxyl-terminal processing protease